MPVQRSKTTITNTPNILPPEIVLPDTSTIGKVEATFDEFFNATGGKDEFKTLIISFALVEWLDISALVFMISAVYKRHIEGKLTLFRLPKNDGRLGTKILIYLHTWRFFEVLRDITGKTMREYMVNPESFNLIISFTPVTNRDGTTTESTNETPEYMNLAADYFRKFYRDDEGLKTLHFDKDFFPLISRPFRTKPEQFQTLTDTLSAWDKDSLIVSILEKHINNSRMELAKEKDVETTDRISIQNKLASDVIKESLTNAIRHPDANLLVTSSFFDSKGKHFTIVIWDNGKSLVESLKSGLKEFGKIRNESSLYGVAGLNPSYLLIDDETNASTLTEEDIDSRLHFSHTLPRPADADWKFLLASFYPGVTSQPVVRKSGKRIAATQLELNFGEKIGMGLTVLLDSIIKVFDGTVTVRIDNQMISIKRIQQQYLDAIYRKKKNQIFLQPLADRYERHGIDKRKLTKTTYTFQVKIVRKVKAPLFCGNMLTLRIPLK